MNKLSVCIATYNGEEYIKEQLESILMQIDTLDEIIISDDSSSDNTLNIIKSINDKRIKIYPNNKFHSPIFNFENALKKANGDYIFLCDQDDVWLPNKVKIMKSYLKNYDMVVSDCIIVDKNLNQISESFYKKFPPQKGFLQNLIKNHYLGCCMAFKKEILNKALPFPPHIAMHDIWLGLCAEAFFKSTFIEDKLIKYRRHNNNASSTSEKSRLSFKKQILYRLYFLRQIITRILK